jgi:RimJ/RimL family protein N-acetyltransferase
MFKAEKYKQAIQSFLFSRQNCQTRLRLVGEADAPFILQLRLDSGRNQNISATSPDSLAQTRWITSYEQRYLEGLEAYFIIQNQGRDVGTVRIYDFRLAENSFGWGSWIIKSGTSPGISYQSAILIYDLGFDFLDFAAAHFDVRQANVSVWKFHERLGAQLVHEDELERRYNYPKPIFQAARKSLAKFTQMMN